MAQSAKCFDSLLHSYNRKIRYKQIKHSKNTNQMPMTSVVMSLGISKGKRKCTTKQHVLKTGFGLEGKMLCRGVFIRHKVV